MVPLWHVGSGGVIGDFESLFASVGSMISRSRVWEGGELWWHVVDAWHPSWSWRSCDGVGE